MTVMNPMAMNQDHKQLLLKGCVGEDGDAQEEGGDATAHVGDDGQHHLIVGVQLCPGHVLTNTHQVTPLIATRCVTGD